MSNGSTYKNALLFKPTKGAAMSATANPTMRGEIDRSQKNKANKTWWRKQLESRQEVLVECVTGEVYRYLIGGRQPRLRAEGAGVVLSEHIPYHSPRDYFDRWAGPKDQGPHVTWKRAFGKHLESLVMVLVASMMLEENDLSDQNYGLALAAEAEDDDYVAPQAVAEAPPLIAPAGGKAAPAEYCGFIKIDHGQSLNSLRIADLATHAKFKKRQTGRAMVKYYPVAAGAGVDERKKKDRKNILSSLFAKRQYAMPSHFLSWSFQDFLTGVIDRDYILASEFQPSTFPLFDGRILSLLDISSPTKLAETADRVEAAKYAAVAKLIFTSDEVYRTIARCAVPQDDTRNLNLIVERILANKRTVREAIAVDPDFFAWVGANHAIVEEEITNSKKRMQTKLRDGNELSDRYGSLAAVDAFDPLFAAAKTVGKAFQACAQDAIASNAETANTLRTSQNVRAAWGGGESVDLESLRPAAEQGRRAANSVKLPRHAAIMAHTLGSWRHSQERRALRTLFSTTILAHQATTATNTSRRSAETTAFYNDVTTNATELEADHPVLEMTFGRFRGFSTNVNLFDLAPYLGARGAQPLVGAPRGSVVRASSVVGKEQEGSLPF